MVLVSYIPKSYICFLQTKFSHREGHEARRGGLEPMPLDQDIEGGHGERQARLKIRPAPVQDLFEMADERQHRQHRLDEHPVLPLTALTQFEIRGITLGSMEAGITQNNHPPIHLLNRARSQGNNPCQTQVMALGVPLLDHFPLDPASYLRYKTVLSLTLL